MNNFVCIPYYSLFKISHQDNCKLKILQPVWISRTLHPIQERRIRLFFDEIFFDFLRRFLKLRLKMFGKGAPSFDKHGLSRIHNIQLT